MKKKNCARQKFLTGCIASSRFSLGAGQEKERIQAPSSLSPAPLSLWLIDKEKAPTGEVEAFPVSCGASPIQRLSTNEIGWDVTKRAHPARPRVAHFKPQRNTVLVNVMRIGNGSIVRVGSRHSLEYLKNNGPLDVIEYRTKAPDETYKRANPGDGQVLDPATAATSRLQGIPARVIKPSSRFKTPLITKYAVALSGERLNAKRKPPLWKKLKEAA